MKGFNVPVYFVKLRVSGFQMKIACASLDGQKHLSVLKCLPYVGKIYYGNQKRNAYLLLFSYLFGQSRLFLSYKVAVLAYWCLIV